MSFETRHAETALGRVAYFDEGKGDPLVFIHGLVGTRSHFMHVAPSFAERHRVIGLDLPGCGQSVKPRARVSIRLYADTLLAFLRGLGIERATLVGHSAGGQVVATAAMLSPERVDKLVLINSAGLRDYPLVVRMTGRAIMRPWLISRVLGPSAGWILRQIFHQKKNRFVEQFVADSTSERRDPELRRAALRDMGKVFHDLAPDLLTPSVRTNARRLAMPTLIVWGDRDRLVPLEAVRGIARTFPDAQLQVIRDCGHMPMIEEPFATIDLMRAFLGAPSHARVA
ncbi:MAG: alpha/beta fold hydrolase [Polyangiales bacterium]